MYIHTETYTEVHTLTESLFHFLHKAKKLPKTPHHTHVEALPGCDVKFLVGVYSGLKKLASRLSFLSVYQSGLKLIQFLCSHSISVERKGLLSSSPIVPQFLFRKT